MSEQNETASQPEMTQEHEASQDRLQILIVDDEQGMRDMFSRFMRRSARDRYNIETAANGNEALIRIEEKRYDVIISDFRLPDMHGIELVKKIMKKIQEFSKKPKIAIMSSADLPPDQEIPNGASFIEKPWQPEEMEDILDAMTGGNKS